MYRSNQRKIENQEVASYYMKGLYVRIFGTIATTIIYWYYYGHGDTTVYFARIKYLRRLFSRNFGEGIRIFNMNSFSNDPADAIHGWVLKFHDASSYLVVKIAFILSYPSMGSYIVIALFFTIFCYMGIWSLYLKSIELFPDVSKKYLAYAIIFIPSIFFWGSGLFKDTLTLGAACFVVSSFHDVAIRRKKIISGLLTIIICGYLIGVVKSYILLAMIPAMLIWYAYSFRSKIKSDFLGTSMTPILFVVSGVVGLFMLQQLGKVFTKFNLENIEKKAEDMQRWHTVRGAQLDESSTYSLGHVEFTAMGILTKIPAAVNVTYFRPYLWEARNPVLMMAALESLAFFLLTLYLLFKHFKVFSHTVRTEPFIMFCLIFAFVFGFSVGLTAYNFGALVRYKIPALPMFGIVLAVVLSRVEDAKKLNAQVVK